MYDATSCANFQNKTFGNKTWVGCKVATVLDRIVILLFYDYKHFLSFHCFQIRMQAYLILHITMIQCQNYPMKEL